MIAAGQWGTIQLEWWTFGKALGTGEDLYAVCVLVCFLNKVFILMS